MNIKVLQLHKRSSYEYKFIQDKFAFDLLTNTFAIADGTTQSFNSERWANMITRSFCEKPQFDPDALAKHLIEQAKLFDSGKFDFSKNPALASLERNKIQLGATSTLVGVSIKDNLLSIISCGDSNVFILRSGTLIATFPFDSLEELDNSTEFLNTQSLLHNGISASIFRTGSFNLLEDDTAILATDALSRLILSDTGILDQILEINTFTQLVDFCSSGWKTSRLEEDDITALIIQNVNVSRQQHITPPIDFTFEKEPVREFIPFTPQKSKIDNSTLDKISMWDFNRFDTELNRIKSRQNQHRKILVILLLLSVLSLGLMTFFVSRIAEVQPQVDVTVIHGTTISTHHFGEGRKKIKKYLDSTIYDFLSPYKINIVTDHHKIIK